jgi:hypothetical protein
LKWAAAVLVAGAALASAGCATMTVSSHIQRGLDVAPYRTFDWGPTDTLPASDPRLTKDAFFRDHVEGAIEKALAGKGYERTVAQWPDVLIHYHANIAERVDVGTLDRGANYCYGEVCGAKVFSYESGTLVVDIVDAHTNRLIWRGWAQQSIDDELTNHDKMSKRIDEAVTRMLDQFPSRGAALPPVRTDEGR